MAFIVSEKLVSQNKYMYIFEQLFSYIEYNVIALYQWYMFLK